MPTSYTMKVSTIVLTYNQEETISHTLDSVLSQRFDGDMEVVIGEDCSTDRTRRICLDYERRYPDVVRMMPAAPNKGLVRNYYDCVEACRGDYIQDIAGDDFYTDSDKTAVQTAFLDSHSDAVFVHSGWSIFDTNGNKSLDVIHDYAETEPGEKLLNLLLNHCKPQPVMLSAAMYRRHTVTHILNENRNTFYDYCAEDFPLLAYMAKEGMTGYISRTVLGYTRGGDNAISAPKDREKAARFYVGSIEMSVDVSRRLCHPQPDLSPMIRYAVGLALESGNRLLAIDTVRRIMSCGLKIPLPTRLKLMKFGIVKI